MAQCNPKLLEPFGMVVKFDDGRGNTPRIPRVHKSFIVEAITIVPSEHFPIFRGARPANGNFHITRNLEDPTTRRSTPIRLLTVNVSDGKFTATTKVQWHFKKNEQIKLKFEYEPDDGDKWYYFGDESELHLSGVYVPNEDNDDASSACSAADADSLVRPSFRFH